MVYSSGDVKSSTLLKHGSGGTEDIYIFREDISQDPVVRVNLKFLEKHNIDINIHGSSAYLEGNKEMLEEVVYKLYSTKVRALTTHEAMRLMTFNDDEIERLDKANLCKTRIYALMGNSICVNLLEDILRNYYKIFYNL